MAKKAPLQKPTEVFNYIYIITWAILPLIYLAYNQKVQDPGLFPRHTFLGLSVLISGIVLFTKKARELPFRLTLAAISFFVLWHFVGYTNAFAKTEVWASFARHGLMLSYLLLSFQLLRNKLLNFSAIIKGVTIFAAISCLAILPGIISALKSGNYIEEIYNVRVLFTHKNFAASALLLSIPFTYLGTRLKSPLWSKVAMVTLILSIIEIAVLRTRGVWIGFFAGVGATIVLQFLSKQKENKQLKWVGIGTGVFAVLLAIIFMTGSNAEKLLNKGNIDLRFLYWEKCVEMAQDHPIAGVGAGNWKINFPGYGLQGTNQSVMTGQTQISRPHNDMMQVLAELGIPAWIALALFQLYLLFICVKLLNHVDGEKRNYAMASIFGLVAFAAYGLGEFPMERTLAVGLLVLIAAEALRLGEEENILKKPLFYLPPVALNSVIVGLAVLAIWIGNARIKGETEARDAVLAYNSQKPGLMLKFATKAQNRFFQIDTYNSPMDFFRGMGMAANGNLPQAEQTFKDALAISPYHINTIRQLGDIYKYQKKYDQALKMYDQSLEISPQFYFSHLSKAEVYLIKNQTKKALVSLNRVSPKVEYPKYQAIAVEVMKRIARMPEAKAPKSPITKIAKQNMGNDQQLWRAYLQWRKDFRASIGKSE